MINTNYGIGGYIVAHPSGNRIEEWDYETLIHTVWDSDGTVVSTEALAPLDITPVSPSAMFEAMDPALALAVVTVAAGMVARAGEIWDNTFAMPNEAPGKEALRPIAEAVLEAALPLL